MNRVAIGQSELLIPISRLTTKNFPTCTKFLKKECLSRMRTLASALMHTPRLPSVLKRTPDLRYVIVGEGDDRPRLERLAADLHLTDHMKSMSTASEVSDEELAQYYIAPAICLFFPAGQSPVRGIGRGSA